MENEEVKQDVLEQTGAPQEAVPATEPEAIPSMAEFESQIDHSFRKLKTGDIVTGTVIGISDTEVTVDLNSYAEGIIKQEELSNDPRFSIKADIKIGEEISATVLREDRDGNILLSRKQADDVLAWDILNTMMAERTPATVKVAQVVNAGVVTYLNGIRGFIPASKLDINYVEDLSTFVGKERTLTLTSSPTLSTSLGDLIRLSLIWETCTRPERPLPRSTNAPKGMIFSTLPERMVPAARLAARLFFSVMAFSRRISFAERTSFFLSLSTVITLTSSSFPTKVERSST